MTSFRPYSLTDLGVVALFAAAAILWIGWPGRVLLIAALAWLVMLLLLLPWVVARHLAERPLVTKAR